MSTVTDLLVRLIESVFDLTINFAEIAFSDPFSFVLIALGGAITAGSLAVFTYLVVGALADAVGVELPTLGKGPRDAEGRIPTERPNPNYEDEAAGGAARAKRGE